MKARFDQDAMLPAGAGLEQKEIPVLRRQLQDFADRARVPLSEPDDNYISLDDADPQAATAPVTAALPSITQPGPMDGNLVSHATSALPTVDSTASPHASTSTIPVNALAAIEPASQPADSESPSSHLASLPSQQVWSELDTFIDSHPDTVNSGPVNVVAPQHAFPRSLVNLAWWDNIDVAEMLSIQVLTHPRIPAAMRVACWEARCAVNRQATAHDHEDHAPPWKLLLALDRLLFWRSQRAKGRDTRPRKCAASLSRRLAWFWAGEWQMLWDAAHIQCECGSSRAPTPSLKRQAARIERMMTEGQVSQAVIGLLAKWTPSVAFSRSVTVMSWPQWRLRRIQLWLSVCTEALIASCGGYPLAWPGLDGSRFEFWKPLDDGDPALPPAADCVVQWVMGHTFPFVDELLRKGRHLALQKNQGGLRPLLLAAAFRRIAFKAVVHAAKGEVVQARFAIGAPSGALGLMWGLEAAATHIGPSGAILPLDISIAFGTMILDAAVCASARALAGIFAFLDLRVYDASLVAGLHWYYARSASFYGGWSGLPSQHGGVHDRPP